MKFGPLLDVLLLSMSFLAGCAAYLVGRRVSLRRGIAGHHPKATAKGHIASFALWTVAITCMVGWILVNANAIYGFLGGAAFLPGDTVSSPGEFGGESFIGALAIVLGFPVALAGAVYAIYLAQASLETSTKQALFEDPDYQAKRAGAVALSKLRMLREMLAALSRSQSSLPTLLQALRESLVVASKSPLSSDVVGAICVLDTRRDLSRYVAYAGELEAACLGLLSQTNPEVGGSQRKVKGQVRAVEAHLARMISELQEILGESEPNGLRKTDKRSKDSLVARVSDSWVEAAPYIIETLKQMQTSGQKIRVLRFIVRSGESTFDCEQLLLRAMEESKKGGLHQEVLNAGSIDFHHLQGNMIAEHPLKCSRFGACLVYSPPGPTDEIGAGQLNTDPETYLAKMIAREILDATNDFVESAHLESGSPQRVALDMDKVINRLASARISQELVSLGRVDILKGAVERIIDAQGTVEVVTGIFQRARDTRALELEVFLREALRSVLPSVLFISLQQSGKGSEDKLGLAMPLLEPDEILLSSGPPSRAPPSELIELWPQHPT